MLLKEYQEKQIVWQFTWNLVHSHAIFLFSWDVEKIDSPVGQLTRHEILFTCTWKRVKESSSISTLKLKRWGDRFVQILCSFWKHLELHHFQNAGEQVPSPPAACLWQPSCLGSSEGFCFEPPPDPRPPPENLFLLISLITFVLRVYLFFINSKYFQISRTNCKPLEIRTKSNVCFVERGQ